MVYVSGYADMVRFRDDIGNEVMLKKPFKSEGLAEAVRTALQRVAGGVPHNVVPLRREQS